MRFEIGDLVSIRSSGVVGIVEETFDSPKHGEYYMVRTGGETNIQAADTLDHVRETDDSVYTIQIAIEESAAIATLYKNYPNGRCKAVEHAHGHIMHDGRLGVVQAASYALKKMYLKIEEEETYNNGN